MAPFQLHAYAAFIVAVLVVPATAQSNSITQNFQLGSVPASLEASVITVVSETISHQTVPVYSYEVDCPTAKSPENDACRALSMYPAMAYHTQGSVWGGAVTASAQSATTTWRCALGDCSGCSGGHTGLCTKTITSGGSTVTETTEIDKCYVHQHSVPLVVTAGLDKLGGLALGTVGVSDLLSHWDDQLSVMGCPSRPTLEAAGPSSTEVVTSTGATPLPTATPGSITGATVATGSTSLSSSSTSSTTVSGGASFNNGVDWILTGLGVTVIHLSALLCG
jgi:hypothetical protein